MELDIVTARGQGHSLNWAKNIFTIFAAVAVGNH